MNIDAVIFIISAFVALFGALMMVLQRNAVSSVLYFILSLVAQAALYIQLSAVFVSAILIIVYSGAILVLFLFVIMLLNLRGDEYFGNPSPPIKDLTKYILAIGLTLELGFIIKSTIFARAITTGVMGGGFDAFGSAEQVATLLFTRYLYPFELTSILLLAAIVGAVIIAKKDKSDEAGGKDDQESSNKAKSETAVEEVSKKVW